MMHQIRTSLRKHLHIIGFGSLASGGLFTAFIIMLSAPRPRQAQMQIGLKLIAPRRSLPGAELSSWGFLLMRVTLVSVRLSYIICGTGGKPARLLLLIGLLEQALRLRVQRMDRIKPSPFLKVSCLPRRRSIGTGGGRFGETTIQFPASLSLSARGILRPRAVILSLLIIWFDQ